MGTSESILFEFNGTDSIGRFRVWIVAITVGTLPTPFWFWQFGGVVALGAFVVSTVVIVLGLRTAVIATPERVTITRKWFSVPYWSHSANVTDDVWFEGDWGLDDDAMGVVVRLGRKEVCIGSSSTMHYLYESLTPLRHGGAGAHTGP